MIQWKRDKETRMTGEQWANTLCDPERLLTFEEWQAVEAAHICAHLRDATRARTVNEARRQQDAAGLLAQLGKLSGIADRTVRYMSAVFPGWPKE